MPDALKRLQTLSSSFAGQFTFGYDNLSRRTQLTRPNGVNTAGCPGQAQLVRDSGHDVRTLAIATGFSLDKAAFILI